MVGGWSDSEPSTSGLPSDDEGEAFGSFSASNTSRATSLSSFSDVVGAVEDEAAGSLSEVVMVGEQVMHFVLSASDLRVPASASLPVEGSTQNSSLVVWYHRSQQTPLSRLTLIIHILPSLSPD